MCIFALFKKKIRVKKNLGWKKFWLLFTLLFHTRNIWRYFNKHKSNWVNSIIQLILMMTNERMDAIKSSFYGQLWTSVLTFSQYFFGIAKINLYVQKLNKKPHLKRIRQKFNQSFLKSWQISSISFLTWLIIFPQNIYLL